MREIIELEEGDSLSVVRHKLEHARLRRVALVAPPNGQSLRSQVNLNLIRRSAEALALDLVLVTSDGDIAGLARAAGLAVAASARGAQRRRGWRPPGISALAGKSPAISALASALKSGQALSRPDLGQMSRTQRLAALAVASGIVLVAAVCLALVVPGATVVLDPRGNRVSAEVEVLASPDVVALDLEHARVPARVVQIEVTGQEEGQTTGRQSQPDQHASGEVVFANKGTGELTVPKGTVVRTDDGAPVKFYTLLDVTVPGSYGATARAPIMAFEAGSAGNVEALTIRVVEGDPGFSVDVLNDQPTRGGTEKRIGIISAEDYDRLRGSLMQRLQREAHGYLVKELDKAEWVPPDTLEVAIAEENFDGKVDEPADMLRLTMKVRVSGVAVQGQATEQLMAHALQVRDGEERVVNEATLQVEQPVGKESVEGQTVRFTARASAFLVKPVDLRAVSASMAGKAPDAAARWLSAQYELRRPPEIRIRPGWWRRLPWLPSRIHVELSGGA